MKKTKGEVATLLTISAFIVIGISTLISNLFLKQTNIVKSKAAEDIGIIGCPCQENGECVPCADDLPLSPEGIQPIEKVTNQESGIPYANPDEIPNSITDIPAQDPLMPAPTPWWAVSSPLSDLENQQPSSNENKETSGCYQNSNGQSYQVPCDEPKENFQEPTCPSGTYYDATYGSCMSQTVNQFELPTPTPQWILPWDQGWQWPWENQTTPKSAPQSGNNVTLGNPLEWVSDKLADAVPNEQHPPISVVPTQTETKSQNWWDNFKLPFWSNDAIPKTTPVTEPTVNVSIVENKIPLSPDEKIDFKPKYKYETTELELDKDGIPTKVIVSGDKEIPIDEDTRNKIALLKSQGNPTEPEIIKVIKIPAQYVEPQNQDPLKHPVLKELPKDVLQKEDLAKKGINIYQASSTNLFIRDSAFKEGGALNEFVKYKELYPDAQLNIILADSSRPHAAYITDKSVPTEIVNQLNKYDNSKNISSSDLENYRNKKIADWQRNLENARKDYQQALSSNDSEKIEAAATLVADTKTQIEKAKLMTQAEIKNELLPTKESGIFYTHLGTTYHSATIIIGVGNDDSQNYSTVAIQMNPDGSVIKRQSDQSGDSLNVNAPNSSMSRPNPGSFSLNQYAKPNNPESYPYGVQQTGQILRHEIEHFNLIQVPQGQLEQDMKRWNQELSEWYKVKNNPNPKPQPKTGEKSNSNKSEYDTDMGAMKGIQNAWEKCKAKQFKNCSEYSFIFSLPNNEGFIETNQKNKTPSSQGTL